MSSGMEKKAIEVAIGTMPQEGGEQLPEATADWGQTVQDITPELAQQLGLSSGGKGRRCFQRGARKSGGGGGVASR
jgi:hypothetical protein